MRLRRFRIGVMCTALAGCWLVSTAMTPSAFADPGHIPAPRGPLILAEKGIGPAPGHSLYDLVQSVISGESGWNPTAVNPSSGAFGLFQFNPSWGTLQEYLPSRSPAPYIQALAGMAYIKARYGSPSAAWAFWNKHWPHWYLQGGAVRDVGPKPPYTRRSRPPNSFLYAGSGWRGNPKPRSPRKSMRWTLGTPVSSGRRI